jgi:hypothetical protein
VFVITSEARDLLLLLLTTANRQLFLLVILSVGGASPPESKDPYIPRFSKDRQPTTHFPNPAIIGQSYNYCYKL